MRRHGRAALGIKSILHDMNHAFAGVTGVMKEGINNLVDNQSVGRSVSQYCSGRISTGVFHGLHKWYRSLMIYTKQLDCLLASLLRIQAVNQICAACCFHSYSGLAVFSFL